MDSPTLNFLQSVGRMPRMLWRTVTGQVIATAEMKISGGLTILRVTLKRDAKSGDIYAIVAQHSSGNHQFAYLNADEIDEMTRMMQAVQAVAREHRSPEKAEEAPAAEQDA